MPSGNKIRELHSFVNRAVKATGLTSASDWKNPSNRFEDKRLDSAYAALNSVVVGGRRFAGFETWDDYLERKHGFKLADKWRLSDTDIHRLIREALQKTSGGSRENLRIPLHKWRGYNKPVIGRHSLQSLCQAAFTRKIRGKSFFGHGSFETYMEKKHGVVSLFQPTWSDKRVHYSIAALLKKYPVEEVAWYKETRPRLYGKSLKTLYGIAMRSRVKAKGFFGQGTWEKYVAWIRRNYGRRLARAA